MSDAELDVLLEQVKLGNADPSTKAQIRRVVDQLASSRASFQLRSRTPEKVELLQELCRSYATKETFNVGDLVVWKPGLKNRTVPAYDVPGVVLEVLEPELVDTEKNFGSSYFREPCGIKLAILDEDDELLVFHYDAGRFTRYRSEQ